MWGGGGGGTTESLCQPPAVTLQRVPTTHCYTTESANHLLLDNRDTLPTTHLYTTETRYQPTTVTLQRHSAIPTVTLQRHSANHPLLHYRVPTIHCYTTVSDNHPLLHYRECQPPTVTLQRVPATHC